MKPFTVLLRYPDYLSSEGETYLAWVTARTPLEACQRAQKQIHRDTPAHDSGDYLPLLCIAGHHEDVKP